MLAIGSDAVKQHPRPPASHRLKQVDKNQNILIFIDLFVRKCNNHRKMQGEIV